MAYEAVFDEHDVFLKRTAGIFSYRSRGHIERQEFYQQFALKVIDLSITHKEVPKPDFAKLVNVSVHNSGYSLMREYRKYWPVDFTFGGDNFLLTIPDRTIHVKVLPSFLFLYREAALQFLHNIKEQQIFNWLMCNASLVESFSSKRTIETKHRKLILRTVIRAVQDKFQLPFYAARGHISHIRKSLKVADLQYIDS